MIIKQLLLKIVNQSGCSVDKREQLKYFLNNSFYSVCPLGCMLMIINVQ